MEASQAQIGGQGLIMPGVAAPPSSHYHCPLCGGDLHAIGPHHCFDCGTDWNLEDLLDAIEYNEYEEAASNVW